jgi:hypothetical protein
MDSIDLSYVKRRARRKYEWARVRRALWGFGPSLLVVAAAGVFAKHPTSTLAFGAAMFAAGVSALWYGRGLKHAVLPGFGLGLVPLALALCANRFGHVCTGDGCVALCVPACITGGLMAGVGMAVIGHRHRQGVGYWAAASLIALLTGAMGCSCVGSAGVLGLAAGFGLGVLPGVVRRLKY